MNALSGANLYSISRIASITRSRFLEERSNSRNDGLDICEKGVSKSGVLIFCLYLRDGEGVGEEERTASELTYSVLYKAEKYI